jgi:hypothetical protein
LVVFGLRLPEFLIALIQRFPGCDGRILGPIEFSFLIAHSVPQLANLLIGSIPGFFFEIVNTADCILRCDSIVHFISPLNKNSL